MKVTRSQKRLFVILAIVLAYAAYDIISNADQYRKIYGTARQLQEIATTVPKLDQSLVDSLQKRMYYTNWNKNPFIQSEKNKLTPKHKFRQTKSLQLSGILFEENNSLAIIDGKIVREGENVSGALVKKISADFVTVLKNDKEFILSINGGK